nr:uncharacterized protein LOC126534380 isoform X6 [Dermacentor andersoni]
MTAVASTARWTSRRCFFPGFDNKFCHNTSRWVMSAVRIAVLFYLPLALSGVTLKDLKEALNTREKIWTVYRSYYPSARGHNQTCIYSEMRMTKRGYYIADTHYEVDGVWNRILLKLLVDVSLEILIIWLSTSMMHLRCEAVKTYCTQAT